MQFCEPDTGWQFLRHPADTWSNISPFFLGWVVAARCGKPLVVFVGIAAMWMGVASALFHATDTLLGELLDVHGMYLFLMALLMLQFRLGALQSIVCAFSVATAAALG